MTPAPHQLELRAVARSPGYLTCALARAIRARECVTVRYDASRAGVRTPFATDPTDDRAQAVLIWGPAFLRRVALSALGIHLTVRVAGEWRACIVPWYAITHWSRVRA